MKIIAIVGILLLAMTPSYAADIDAQMECLTPWYNGFEKITKLLPDDQDVRKYRNMISRAVIGEMLMVNGKLAVSYKARPSPDLIVIVPICKNPPKELTEPLTMAAHVRGSNVILLNGTLPAPELLRGLILAHELHHLTDRSAAGQLKREFDAYIQQFRLATRARLSGYESIVAEIASGYSPSIYDERLDMVFPDLGDNREARGYALNFLKLAAIARKAEDSSLSPRERKKFRIALVNG